MASTSSDITEEASTSSFSSDAMKKKRRIPTERTQQRRQIEREQGGGTESNIEKERRESEDALIFKPAEWILQLIALQVKVIFQVFSLIAWTANSCVAVVSQPVQKSMEAKERAKEAMTHGLGTISQMPPRVTEGGGIVLRKLGLGCLAASYVLFILVIFMLLAMFLGMLFVNCWVDEPVIMKKPLYFDYTQPNPNATVWLSSSGSSKDRSGRRAVPLGHKFHGRVTFIMPESNYNRRIGMFQVTAELMSEKDGLIAKFSQPCMLRFYSMPIRIVKMFAVSIPLLVGVLGETQTVVVDLIDYEEGIIPTKYIKITLQPKAGSAELPELYSAEIDIHSHLPWAKDFIHNWKWTFSIWASLTFYLMLVGFFACCCKQVFVPRSSPKTDPEKARENKTAHTTSADSSTSMPTQMQRYGQRKPSSIAKAKPAFLQKRTTVRDPNFSEDKGKGEMLEESVVSESSSAAVDDPSKQTEKSEIKDESCSSENVPSASKHGEESCK